MFFQRRKLVAAIFDGRHLGSTFLRETGGLSFARGEAFAGAEAELGPGQDIVVVARPEARELTEREGLAGIDASLAELLARAGLRSGRADPEEKRP